MYVKRNLIVLVSVLALLVAAGADAAKQGKGGKKGSGGTDPGGDSAPCYTLSVGAEPIFADDELVAAELAAQFDGSECGRVSIDGSLEWLVDGEVAASSAIEDNQASASAIVTAEQLMESEICLRAHGTLQELKGNGDPKGDPVPFDEMVCL